MRTMRLYWCLFLAISPSFAQVFNTHTVILDRDGKLVSWVQPQDKAYDHVVYLAWNFLLNKVHVEPNGLKSYYTYCCIDGNTMKGGSWPHNPAGLFAMLADSGAAYYAYSGDRKIVDLVKGVLDYQIAHGTTPASWKWGDMPYASADHGATEYRGAHESNYDNKRPGRGDGVGGIEPDKSAELGAGYLKFYELTGDSRYRDAAIKIADTLAKDVRPGSTEKSPWPFRVFAETGVVREEYASDQIAMVRLFDALIRLNLGDTKQYKSARDIAWHWLLEVPMKNNVWAQYFEDIPIMDKLWNFNQYAPMETARHLLDHPESDPEWRAHVSGLIAFVEDTFAGDIEGYKGVEWGANTISEQLDYKFKMGSHTSRYASVLARWAEVTSDPASKEKAFRSLNWATYMCREDGVVNDQPKLDQNGIWFSDGYGDYIRHFMYAMGAQPEWSPAGENHLLRSSSIVQEVSYSPAQISYRTFDNQATEVLRVSFVPKEVTAGGKQLEKRNDLNSAGWMFDSERKVLRLRHDDAGTVKISGN
ncbi:MAG TPA: hypothetical protein VKV39_11745 [Candidatus Sulfotelmatobacter sp.]|nr:hypothetical protein [Candidatus Sulfotelmatobacter sp.]